ncbi:MAG: hypothetical protein ALECFALPRED_000631 [Alectoria fallacina]|uniref:Rhodopsin domain-containing protein n=1 Tax=Alectoria fallacina TaxID=1903189 RepID=A0A8H3I339_9LECA|nr:MAG: hypothetical protein ALECFALPRED_000631 [Alectoria fallacina]
MGAIKISTLLLFARIFPGQKFQRMLWAVGLFISTYSSIMVIAMIFQCRPLNRVWDPTVKAECIEINKVWIVMGSLNVVTDFLLLCLPLPQIWKLQMRRETKLQLISIFSIGSFVTVVSTYRITQLRGLSLYSSDPTWNDVEANIWTIVEVSAAMLGACAITYRPLFNWFFRDLIFKTKSSSTRPEERKPNLGIAKMSVGHTRTGFGSNNRDDTKIKALNVPRPSVPLSIYNSRKPGRGDGYRQINRQ